MNDMCKGWGGGRDKVGGSGGWAAGDGLSLFIFIPFLYFM